MGLISTNAVWQSKKIAPAQQTQACPYRSWLATFVNSTTAITLWMTRQLHRDAPGNLECSPGSRSGVAREKSQAEGFAIARSDGKSDFEGDIWRRRSVKNT